MKKLINSIIVISSIMLVTGCACAPIVQTETVYVNVPQKCIIPADKVPTKPALQTIENNSSYETISTILDSNQELLLIYIDQLKEALKICQ